MDAILCQDGPQTKCSSLRTGISHGSVRGNIIINFALDSHFLCPLESYVVYNWNSIIISALVVLKRASQSKKWWRPFFFSSLGRQPTNQGPVWLSKALLTVSFIAFSSSSSSRKAAERMALIAYLGRPARADIWRHIESASCDTSSPGGQSRPGTSAIFFDVLLSDCRFFSSWPDMGPRCCLCLWVQEASSVKQMLLA